MTQADRQIADLIASVSAGELSSLIALRVLASATEPGEWMPVPRLVEEVRREYARRSNTAGQGMAIVSPPWESTPASEDGMAAYIRDHVIRRWSAEGVLEFDPASDAVGEESGEPTAVRIVPDIDLDRGALLHRLDLKIEDSAATHEPLDPDQMPLEIDTRSEPVAEGHSTLAASGLVKIYRKRRVVNDVAVQVSQGEIVGLLGPNGAGKTTTFYMMVGLIAPDAGRVRIGDEDVTRIPMYRRARKGVGYLAQEPSVFRKLTVEENVLAILQMMGISRREQKERLELLLDELGIKHLRKARAYSLSGGERRRLEITRALVGRPKFMLLDEPFAGVDPIAVHDIQQIVADLRRRNIGVLISDHNVEQTLDIVDRAYIMYDGRVRVSGTVSELVWNDEVAEIYLGPTLTARMRQRYSFPE
jgi:lipopolysaccharide export system ATP-binding protein